MLKDLSAVRPLCPKYTGRKHLPERNAQSPDCLGLETIESGGASPDIQSDAAALLDVLHQTLQPVCGACGIGLAVRSGDGEAIKQTEWLAQCD